MKKKLFAIPILAVLLCGCNSDDIFKSQKPDFDTAYSTTAEISYGKFKADCDITRNGTGDWAFSFNKPDYLMGIDLTLDENGVTASLGELNVNADINSTYRLIPDIIADSIDLLSAADSESITADENGMLTINTELDGKKVVVTADKNGKLISLKCPYHKLSVNFSEQLPIAQQTEPAPAMPETEEVSIIFEDEE